MFIGCGMQLRSLSLKTERAASLPVQSHQSHSYWRKCVLLLSLALFFKVEHDYIFLLNTTLRHFVGKQGVGGVAIALNAMKLHYELASSSSSSSFALPAPHPTLQACIKNLEILSFPSFRLPLCLPKRTRHSCNIRQDEKKLSAA